MAHQAPNTLVGHVSEKLHPILDFTNQTNMMPQRSASGISGESLPSAGAVIGTMAFICAIYLLATSVGLSKTFAIYADHANGLICGNFGAFSNYKQEPLFFLIMWVGSEIWNFLFFPGCTPETSSPNFWLPIFLSGFFILQFSYVTRHLRWFAVYYHIALCLDAGTFALPFHLLRQFIAVVIVVMALSMLLTEEIGPGKFVAYLVAASLIHFSAWLLVALALVALYSKPRGGFRCMREGDKNFSRKMANCRGTRGSLSCSDFLLRTVDCKSFSQIRL